MQAAEDLMLISMPAGKIDDDFMTGPLDYRRLKTAER